MSSDVNTISVETIKAVDKGITTLRNLQFRRLLAVQNRVGADIWSTPLEQLEGLQAAAHLEIHELCDRFIIDVNNLIGFYGLPTQSPDEIQEVIANCRRIRGEYFYSLLRRQRQRRGR